MQYQEEKAASLSEIKALICSAMGADRALADARNGRVKEGSIVTYCEGSRVVAGRIRSGDNGQWRRESLWAHRRARCRFLSMGNHKDEVVLHYNGIGG